MKSRQKLITADCPRCGRQHSAIEYFFTGVDIRVRCPRCGFSVGEDENTYGLETVIKKWNAYPKAANLLSEKELIVLSHNKCTTLFGAEFVNQYRGKAHVDYSYKGACFECLMAYDVQDGHRSRKGPRFRGWTYWVRLYTDLVTGDATIVHCCLPNGKRKTT